ncbi:MAG: polysaccharide deacetylase family protein [Alloprevotella sp.]|nr:polysaccharide deacetylase family protein [Alloprevotella sp.]
MIRTLIKNAMLLCGACLFRNTKSKLLYYHDVFASAQYTDMGTPLTLFQQHVRMIREQGFKIVPRISEAEREVALLLDDGFRGIYDVRDYLQRENICPTVFLAVSLIGKDGYLNKEEIKELQGQGFIFQCHAWSHEDLTTFTDEELKRELGESKAYLEDLLGKEVDEICLPIGYFSDHLIEEIKKYGYTRVYSSIPGNYFEPVVGGMTARNLVQFASPRQVKYMLFGGNWLIKKRYERMHHKM